MELWQRWLVNPQAALAIVAVVVVAGCTVTTGGVPVPAGRDQPVVALMDTGKYSVTAGSVSGAAGDEGVVAEALRMASFIVGPWQVDSSLIGVDFFAAAPLEDFASTTMALGWPISDSGDSGWTAPFTGIAQAHGFVVGFLSGRTAGGELQRLQNAVMRFPDHEAAAAAAGDMVGVRPPADATLRKILNERKTFGPWQPDACKRHPDRVGADFSESAAVDQDVVVRAISTYGQYVFSQLAVADSTLEACTSIQDTMESQETKLDRFEPTEVAKMAELPLDPTGRLEARTLDVSDSNIPYSYGVWQADGWLHFEGDPVKAATWFKDAGVDWVVQRLARVYQARDAASADRLADQFATDTAAESGVQSTDEGVPGFPTARCFEQTDSTKWVPHNKVKTPSAWIAMWHFKCIATTDRYAFMSFSDEETDAKQQISAQYRILAGE